MYLKNKLPKRSASGLFKHVLFSFDGVLLVLLSVFLTLHYSKLLAVQYDGLVLTVLSVVATLPVAYRTLLALKNKKLSIDLLAGIALVFSLLTRQWPAAAFINLMLTSARILDKYTQARSRRVIESLTKLRPQKARVKKGDSVEEVDISQLKAGDIVIVGLGEAIPVDGQVIEGQAEVDQSMLTGESLAIEKKSGDQVLSSTIVASGNMSVKTTKVGRETTIEKIIELVESAAATKPKIVSSGEVFASWYIAIMIVVSAVTYLVSHDLALVLAVVLVVCADDIAIAVPLAFTAAIGHAARNGVIIKGADYLEAVGKTNFVVSDKTGTLTLGKLKIDELFVFPGYTRQEVLSTACSLLAISDHPSAKAICQYAKDERVGIKNVEQFKDISGRGAEAEMDGHKLVSGKIDFLKEAGVDISEEQLQKIENAKNAGYSTILIGRDKELIGFFTFSDQLRSNAKSVISDLKKLGIKNFIILTGDNEKITQRIAEQVGATEYYANLLPEDKLKYLKKYLGRKYKVMAIGDGVNDAAILNAADVGVAMGGIGADVTVESGDMVLMQDNLSKIPETIRLAHFTQKVARQDFLIWAITNSLGLYLVFSGLIPKVILPTVASAYNFITDFVPILNSIRLFKVHIGKHAS